MKEQEQMNLPEEPDMRPELPEEQSVPEHTVGGKEKEEPVCPSIFDKPDENRFKGKTVKPRKKGSRQIRNIIIASVLCVAIVLSASGVCHLLYGKGLIQFGVDYFTDTESSTSSTASGSEQTLVFDYSAYQDSPADTDTLALGGVKSITVQNELDAYSLESHWTTETVIDEQTYEEKTVDTLAWLITDVTNKDVEGVKFNSSTVGYIVSDLLRIPYESVYAEDGTQEIPQGGMTYYEECGITQSKNRSTIYFENGASITVIIGSATPTGNGYFLALENTPGDVSAAGAPKVDKQIYKVESGAVVYYLKAADYYVDKNIVTAVAQADSTYDEFGNEVEDPYFISGALSYFDELSISGLSYEKDFVFEIVEEDQPGYDSIYLMTSPYVQNVDLDAIETLLLPVSEGLSAEECVSMKATSAEIARYGLDDPVCIVRYVIKDVEYIIKIGVKISGEENFYAVMVNDNPSIMAVDADNLTFMTYDEADFASDTLYSCDITEIKSIRVEMDDGYNQLFRLSHGTDDSGEATLSVVTQSGKGVDEESFRDMYVDFLSLTSFTNVTDGKDAASPTMTITLNYNDYDQTDVIRLSPYTDRRYFMSLNGMGSTVVLSTAVEALTESVTGLTQ